MDDIQRVIREAQRQGFSVDKTKSLHFRFKSPRGGIVVTSSTPSDWRVLNNLISRLRREGFHWPHRR